MLVFVTSTDYVVTKSMEVVQGTDELAVFLIVWVFICVVQILEPVVEKISMHKNNKKLSTCITVNTLNDSIVSTLEAMSDNALLVDAVASVASTISSLFASIVIYLPLSWVSVWSFCWEHLLSSQNFLLVLQWLLLRTVHLELCFGLTVVLLVMESRFINMCFTVFEAKKLAIIFWTGLMG